MSAALDIVDSAGLDNLTIRAVAAAVGAPPMSLYTHFANKEELLDLVYLEVSRRLYPDSGHATWQNELTALARHVRATLLAHPSWTPILSRQVPVVSSIAVRERILRLMVEDGASADEALGSCSALMLGVIGFVLLELTFRTGDGSFVLGRRLERLKMHFEQNEELQQPTTREAFVSTADFAVERSFELMLTTMIAGLELRCSSKH